MLCLLAGDSSARPGKVTERVGSAGTATGTAAHCIGKKVFVLSGVRVVAPPQFDQSHFRRAVIADGKRRTTCTRAGIRLHGTMRPGAVRILLRAVGVISKRSDEWKANLARMCVPAEV